MIRHCVMFRWKDGVTEATIEQVRAGLSKLATAVPSIRAYRYGSDVGVNTGNFDFSVTADFDDEDGYLVYRDHPVHKQFIADHIVANVAERAAVQFAF